MGILIWMASTSVKSAPLAEYEAHYAISWHGIAAGESVHKLHRNNNGHYHFEARTKPHVQILPFQYVESSDFIWEGDKILPQNYYYNVKEGKRRKKGNVTFDWNTRKLHNRETKEPWETAITEGIQDKLTQTLCLRQALIAGQTQIAFSVAEEDKIKNYAFKILAKESLKTKLGILETVKVEHVSRKGHRTTLWLAKKYDYVPVKMMQSRQGKVVASGEIMSFSHST